MNSEPDDSPSSEELAQKLTEFGLSINQAKVFLSIAQLKKASVGEITGKTRVHRQDIYKIMPILIKKGLVTKIIDKPMKFEALPIEKGIDSLVSAERKNAEERVSRLASISEVLKNEIVRLQNDYHIKEVEPKFSLLVADFEIRNMFDLSFENVKEEFKVVTTPALAPRIIRILAERIKLLTKRKIKTKIIIDNSAGDIKRIERIAETLQSVHSKFLVIKQLSNQYFPPYRVFDDKEAWIMINKETETGQPCFLWTNSSNVTRFYKDNFEKAWNDPNAEVLYGPHDSQ